MAKRSEAGAMRQLVTFQRRETINHPDGGTRGEWVDQFTVPARLQPRYGSNAESLMASRMQSMQPYNLTIRSSGQARQVTASWRAYDARAGKTGAEPNRVFGIKTVVNPDERNAYLEILVIEGEYG